MRGFTLLEICIAVFIAALLVTLAVPSLGGLLAEQKAKRSFAAFDALSQEAQRRSISERRAYEIAWEKKGLALRAVQPDDQAEKNETLQIEFAEQETFALLLPAALVKKPEARWTFWPSGTCEPATITHRGDTGDWTAVYDPLTVRADFTTP